VWSVCRERRGRCGVHEGREINSSLYIVCSEIMNASDDEHS